VPAAGMLTSVLRGGVCVLLAGAATLYGVQSHTRAPQGTVVDAVRPSPPPPLPARHGSALRAVSADRVARPLLPPRFRVGALFSPRGGWHSYCTASVVDSPHRDLLITAAHCVHDGRGGDYRHDIAFTPGDGTRYGPAGVWQVRRELVDPGWIGREDPDVDVAFVVLQPRAGRNIQDLAGANPVAFGYRPGRVGLIGYPDRSSRGHSCTGRVHRAGGHQMRIYCPGFTSGTSGTPWLVGPGAATTGSGTLIGVIGGRDRGGSTADVSYSTSYSAAVAALYRQAVAMS
jgi:V8-like Glu-specific endopeptidase